MEDVDGGPYYVRLSEAKYHEDDGFTGGRDIGEADGEEITAQGQEW